jgi:hypothetical protein
MPKNKLTVPYHESGVWNVEEIQSSNSKIIHTFETESEAQEFITNYMTAFDPTNRALWETVLACLADDEDGSGYLFDHLKGLETEIKRWMEKA